jgi:hypothetical protein
MTLDSLKNRKIHTFLVEEIRRKVTEMGKINWKIQFRWVEAQVGIQGNELADTLAKEAVTNPDITKCYKKVPRSVVISELDGIIVEKWQREWDQTTKGEITKDYFPVVADRLNMKINITQNFTTVVTWHGNIKSYLHRFKIIETPTCPCGTKNQTIDHLLLECELLKTERDSLKSTVLKTDVWPISKNILIRKHYKKFAKFTNEISFDKLNEALNPSHQVD